MKKSTITIIILTIVLIVAIGSGLWTFVLKEPVTELKDELLNQNNNSDSSPTEEKLLTWILDNQKDSLELAVKTLKNDDPELSKKLKKYLKNQPNPKNKLFVPIEVEPSPSKHEEYIESIPVKEQKSHHKEVEIKESISEVIVSSNNDNTISAKYLKFKVDNNSVYYTGDIVDGKANGFGKGVFDNGLVYEGTWVNNKKEGKGTLRWPDGSVYEGQFSNNSRTGKGTLISRNQEKYVGDWLNDNRHGEGTLYDKKGKIKYKGEWKSDVFIP